MDALQLQPMRSSKQLSFETCMVSEMKIRHGALAFSETGNRYLNEHIQWIWEQFCKDERSEDAN